MTHVTQLTDDELTTALRQAQSAYWQAYLESIKNDVPALLELVQAIEGDISAERERRQADAKAEGRFEN